ncbi:MAG: ATP-binding protein [Lachnospiraceae bacterium]|nr:ATP-binding protein [Lachnospiraceae bacterium]
MGKLYACRYIGQLDREVIGGYMAEVKEKRNSMKFGWKEARRIVVALFLMLIIGSSSFVMLNRLWDISEERCWNSLHDAADSIDNLVYEYLNNYVGALRNLQRACIGAKDLHDPQLAEDVREIRVGALGANARLYLSDGYAATEYGVEEDISDRVDFMEIAHGGVFISAVHSDIFNSNRNVIEEYIPVYRDGVISAMLSIVLDIDDLEDVIENRKNSDKEKVIIIDRRDEQVIVDTGHSIMEAGSRAVSQKLQSISEWDVFYQKLISAEECRGEVKDENGYSKYLYGLPSSVGFWSTAVAVDEEIAFTDYNEIKTISRVLLVVETIIFVLYIIWMLYDFHVQIEKESEKRTKILRESYEQDAELYKRTILTNSLAYLKVDLTENRVISYAYRTTGDESMEEMYDEVSEESAYSTFIKNNSESYIHPEYRESYLSQFSQSNLIDCFNEGKIMPEYVFRTNARDNRKDYRKVVSYLSKDEQNGNILAMIVTYDISKEMEQLEEEKELQTVIASIAMDYECMLCMKTITGEVSYYGRAEKFDALPSILDSKLTLQEKIERFKDKYVLSEDHPKFDSELSVEILNGKMRSGKSYITRYRLFVDNEIHWYQLKFIFHREGNERRMVIVCFRNIDDEIIRQNRHQDDLENALIAARGANEAKTQFLFNMSHDIRTPINAVLGFADIAEKNADNEEKVKDCLQKLKVSGNQLLNIINDVLELARIESGQIKINPVPYDLDDYTQGIRNTFEPFFEGKNQEFIIESNYYNRYIYIDYARVNRVLFNLLSNAVKYTPSGGRVSCKTIQGEVLEDGRIPYSWIIEDNGIGMSREYQKRLFERFSREHSSTEIGIEGTGLGLAMVRELVDRMEGSIEVDSEQGRGTRVTVTIPLTVCPAELLEKPGDTSDLGSVSLEGKRILVVEDIDLNRELAVEMLMDEGVIVDEAANGELAVEMVKKAGDKGYDAILMDVQMPVMNGYEATRAIRALEDKRLASIPVIAVTANAFEEDRQAAFNAGMNEHVSKPVTAEKLKEIMGRYVK